MHASGVAEYPRLTPGNVEEFESSLGRQQAAVADLPPLPPITDPRFMSAWQQRVVRMARADGLAAALWHRRSRRAEAGRAQRGRGPERRPAGRRHGTRGRSRSPGRLADDPDL